jgi:hypothetical protein
MYDHGALRPNLGPSTNHWPLLVDIQIYMVERSEGSTMHKALEKNLN